MKAIAILFLIIIFPTAMLSASAINKFYAKIYSDNSYSDIYDFEIGDLSYWDTTRLPNSNSVFVLRSSLARFGDSHAHFILRNGDKSLNSNRVEIKNNFHARQDSDLWYSFSSYLPQDFSIGQDNHCVTAQWHDQESTTHFVPAGQVSNPPISHRISGSDGGKLVVKLKLTYKVQEVIKSEKIVSKKVSRGWSDYIYNIVWSSSNDRGKIRIWERTTDTKKYNLIADYHGVTRPNRMPVAAYNKGPYLKFGLYCKNEPKKHFPLHIGLDHFILSNTAQGACPDKSAQPCPGFIY